MWRSLAKRATEEKLMLFSNPVQDSFFIRKFSGPSCQNSNLTRPSCAIPARSYGTAAAHQVVVSTDESELSGSDEVLEPKRKVARRFRKRTVARMGVAKYATLKKRQIEMETEAWDKAAKEYEEFISDMCEKKRAPNLPYMNSLMLSWFEPLRNAIKAAQDVAKNDLRCRYGQHFGQLPADEMAVITMHTIVGLAMTSKGADGNILVLAAALAVGKAIEDAAIIHKLREKLKWKSYELEAESDALTKEQKKVRKKINVLLEKKKGYELRIAMIGQDDSVPWGQDIRVQVGGRLIDLMLGTAYTQPPVDDIRDGTPDIRPAFVKTMKTVTDKQHGGRRYGVIMCDPLLRKGLENSARNVIIPYRPMLVPPRNWRGYDKGAYLFLQSFVMRTHGSNRQCDAVNGTPPEQLKPVFEALDTLGQTKWRVNKRVLAVADRIWASGGRLAGLVDREDLAFPEEPDTYDEAGIMKWKWKVNNIKKENSDRHSQRCNVDINLAVAREFRDEEGFYYPHNVDFRGRAYPLHSHLNHLGSDLCRGILEFAEGRPLGKSGFRWLKIHLANQYGGGVDKLPFEDRAAFTENHINDILDSADRPLEGRRWWLGAEDPFQCLATCINLAEALRSSSPHTTVSHVPIHQDGSCNGLQHYAALGRNEHLAASVNLVGQKTPADVYSVGYNGNFSEEHTQVLDLSRVGDAVVKHIVHIDAKKDPETDPNALLAKTLVNQVDRKLVKKTVMTSVYGVTFIGARDQIYQLLKERGVATEDLNKAACYAAKVTLKALDQTFKGPKRIKAWLKGCAMVITADKNFVRWTTPLGLPVVQPYCDLTTHKVKTSLQTLSLQIETDKVNAQKQRTAFAPNFVHSLDSSHMMMTAVACRKAGLNFAGVHDSYWTHASDVDVLNRILREKFVELYDAPILENLLKDFKNSFPGLKYPRLRDQGAFDLKQVLESPYFFN